ncbi:MAG TPA: CRTAC1 family protein, partial [Thermoanaerobaculia bacterium]|nr:CRTAC1 family protein [Thermoanaerobaculia bacterium]
ETIGAGVVAFDADGDGRQDLLFVQGGELPGRPGGGRPGAPQGLYLNRGGFRFEAAGPEWGLDLDAYCLGAAAADVDADGDTDLFLSCLGRDRLLDNRGGRFVDPGRRAGLADADEFGAGAAFFDAEGDGWLDLLVARYVTWSPESDLFCSLDGVTKTYCTPVEYPGASPRFYRNLGDGTFREATAEAGFAQPGMKAMGVALLDLGDDGRIDVAVAGDTQPNLLYENAGDGRFEEIGTAAGVAFSATGAVRGGMGIDAADYDGSGRPDLVISYFSQEMLGLYEGRGDGFFVDVARQSEVGPKTLLTLGWGTFFFDFDLDGRLDLFVANGHLDAEIERVQGRIRYAQPQQLFWNAGDGRYVEVTDTAGGDLALPRVARGAAFADLDDDGDLDLALSTNGGPAAVFENRAPERGHWLRVGLEGEGGNRDGVGARVEVEAGGAVRRWLVRTGGSYLSQSQLEPVFGLGDAGRVERLTVRWPSGRVSTLADLPADRRVVVREADASAGGAG